MPSPRELPPDGMPLGNPNTQSCWLCGRQRSALAIGDLPRRAGKFNPKSTPYYICAHCDRDPVEGWAPDLSLLDGRGTE